MCKTSGSALGRENQTAVGSIPMRADLALSTALSTECVIFFTLGSKPKRPGFELLMSYRNRGRKLLRQVRNLFRLPFGTGWARGYLQGARTKV